MIYELLFSATGRSAKVADIIAAEFEGGKTRLDLTDPALSAGDYSFTREDFCIFTTSVYEGRVPSPAVKNLQKLAGKRIKVSVSMGMDPSAVSRTDDEPYQRLRTAIRGTWTDAVVSPYLMLACSDARHYSPICEHVYRFSAMALSKEERGMIHANNERIPLETIAKTVAFYQRFIRMC